MEPRSRLINRVVNFPWSGGPHAAVVAAFLAAAASVAAMTQITSLTAEPDTRFGRHGIARLPAEYGFRDMAVDRQGRVLLALSADPGGERQGDTSFKWALRRLRADGTTDQRFGRGGMATVRVPTVTTAVQWLATPEGPTTVAVGSRGESVLVGEIVRGRKVAAAAYIGVVKFTPDGERDKRFGRNGMVKLRVRRGHNRYPVEAFVQRSGRVVIVANFMRGNVTAMFRLNRDGSRDRSFGTQRWMTVIGRPAGLYPEKPVAVAMRRDERFAAAHLVKEGGEGSGYSVRVSGFTRNGRIDDAYGHGGYTTVDGGVQEQVFEYSYEMGLSIAPDGSQFVLTMVKPKGARYVRSGAGVLKFTTDGELDRTFGTGGMAAETWPGFAEQVATSNPKVMAARNGSVFLLGQGEAPWFESELATCNGFALVRLETSGRLDRNWAAHGRHCIGGDATGWEVPIAIDVDRRRRIVIASELDIADPWTFVSRVLVQGGAAERSAVSVSE